MDKASDHKESMVPIQMDEGTKALLRSPGALPKEIEIRGRKYYPKEPKGEGFKGVVWRGKDEYGGEVAIKFTVFADYMEKSYLEETTPARVLGSSDYFARFIDAGVAEIALPGETNSKFIIFIEQWINGATLASFVKEHFITPQFFLCYVRWMCGALGVLAEKQYRHDDLRPENVMIEEPERGDIVQEEKVKIIDTGSVKSAAVPTRKLKDDYRWFAEHLLILRNKIWSHKPISLHAARFLKEIDPLLDRMFEEDRGAALWAPSRVCTEFMSAGTRVQTSTFEEPVKLLNPFDYIAAEHIVSEELLVKLFADSCPWFAEISSPNPVLLTGPRGCGKSMAFRRMSLRALLYKSPEDIRSSQIVGFYISCSSDLRNRLGWIKTELAARRFRNEIIHYFNLLVSREIVQALGQVAEREDRQSLFGFGKAEETNLHDYLMTQIHVSEPGKRQLQGMNRMQHALELIEQKMDECYRAMRTGVTASDTTDASFLAGISRLLAKSIDYFKRRKVALLIDDFSVHRLPGPVQSILNVVLWDRQGTYISKVSAEKYGATGIDELRATSEVTRELREFDCGQYYLEANYAVTRAFANDLLAIRLRLSEYKGTPERLIGDSEYGKGGLGQALRAKSHMPGRRNDQYHGMTTIADICSGDVSNLLEVFRRIFEHGRVNIDSIDHVSNHIQHTAIQSVSRDLFELIKDYTPLGPEMYQAVNWFGNLSRRILQEAQLIKHGDSSYDPPQTTRIEMEPPATGQPSDELTKNQQDLMDELVRRTIFIEMQPGRSRHQFTTTLRWQLRKIYCPAFGTSIYKNTAIKWRPDQFKLFLIDPKKACEEEFDKKWSRSESNEEPSLFPKGGK